jgi:endonuclease/exonuclease/phosphatase (EEP) superfamily protein YafD
LLRSIVASALCIVSVLALAGGRIAAITAHTPQMGEVDLIALHPRPPYEKKAWINDYRLIMGDLHGSASASARRPVVIAGDLNATLDQAPLRRMHAMGFADAVDQLNLGFQPTWPADGSVRIHGIRIPAVFRLTTFSLHPIWSLPH